LRFLIWHHGTEKETRERKETRRSQSYFFSYVSFPQLACLCLSRDVTKGRRKIHALTNPYTSKKDKQQDERCSLCCGVTEGAQTPSLDLHAHIIISLAQQSFLLRQHEKMPLDAHSLFRGFARPTMPNRFIPKKANHAARSQAFGSACMMPHVYHIPRSASLVISNPCFCVKNWSLEDNSTSWGKSGVFGSAWLFASPHKRPKHGVLAVLRLSCDNHVTSRWASRWGIFLVCKKKNWLHLMRSCGGQCRKWAMVGLC